MRIFFILIFSLQLNLIFAQTEINNDLSNVKFIYEDSTVYLNYQNQKDSLVFPVMKNYNRGLQKSLLLENLIGISADSIVSEFTKCGCGYTSFNYLVNYQNNDVISFSFFYKYYGSYLTENTLYRTFNLKTGKVHTIIDKLNSQGLAFILKSYKNTLLKRLSNEKQLHSNTEDLNILDYLKKRIENLEIKDLDENCVMLDEAFYITSDDNIPHFAKSLSIDMSLEFATNSIRKYKKKGSIILK